MNSVHIEVHRIEKEYPEAEQEYLVYVRDDYGNGHYTTNHDFDSPEDILQHCIDFGSDESAEVCAVIDTILEYQMDITLNNVPYTWDKIRHIFGMDE